jgi:hypothetical protein
LDTWQGKSQSLDGQAAARGQLSVGEPARLVPPEVPSGPEAKPPSASRLRASRLGLAVIPKIQNFYGCKFTESRVMISGMESDNFLLHQFKASAGTLRTILAPAPLSDLLRLTSLFLEKYEMLTEADREFYRKWIAIAISPPMMVISGDAGKVLEDKQA